MEVMDPVEVGAGLHLFVAPNGAGKTTLLRTLAGLSEALAGKPRVGGKMLYLSDELQSDPELKPKTLFWNVFKGRALERAHELADTLKLKLSTPVGKLSRGNRQKVLLIILETRLFAAGSGVVLMDEPLTGLDAETRRVVVNLWAEASTPRRSKS